MIQKIDKYGNTSTDDGRVIVLDKYANIKKVNKAIWGSITGTLTDQIDLTTYLSTNYYPLTSNPAGYITSADVTLQNAYTNSIDGQIILDDTRGPFKVKGSVPNSVLFELLDLANVEAISFLSNGDVKIRDNASIYYDAFNSIKFDTANGVSLKSFDYTKADGRIQYATDYTSLYTSRTLIDKGYADAHYLGTGSAYTLPIASSSVLGGVKIGSGVSIAGDGTISISTNYQAPLSGTGFVKISGSTITYDNSAYYLASNPSGYTSNTGTITSIAAITLGTSGTDLSSSVANPTTTPIITLNVPTASATNRGALSSTDWSTFNNKQDKSMSAYSLRVNNTNATANATETNFRAQALQSLSGITWTGVTAPTGGSQSYQWQQVGNQVVATFTAIYSVAGSALTQVNIALPSDMPTPIRPTGVTATAGAKCYIGIASLSGSSVTLGTTNTCFMVVNATDTSKFDIVVNGSSSATRVFYITITYFTA